MIDLKKKAFLDISKAFERAWHQGLFSKDETAYQVTF